MLLNAAIPLTANTILTPVILRDQFITLREGCVHGIIDHDNFRDKADPNKKYGNYIENIIDIPNSGKLFVGKWLDLTAYTQGDSSWNTRFRQYVYADSTGLPFFTGLKIHDINVGNDTNDGLAWWRWHCDGAGDKYLEIGKYVAGVFTRVCEIGPITVAGWYAFGPLPTFTITGTIVIPRDAPFMNINTYIGPFYDYPIDFNSLAIVAGDENRSWAMRVYGKFSEIAGYANQKQHFIRNMDFQVSMTKEGMDSKTQGMQAPVERTGSSMWMGRRTYDPAPIKKENMTPEEERRYNLMMKEWLATVNGLPFYNQRVSIINRFRIEKPYASDLVAFNPRGSSKLKLTDDAGNLIENKINYGIYVSGESEDEVEITIHSIFQDQTVLGVEDYCFVLGSIEMLFEARI